MESKGSSSVGSLTIIVNAFDGSTRTVLMARDIVSMLNQLCDIFRSDSTSFADLELHQQVTTVISVGFKTAKTFVAQGAKLTPMMEMEQAQ